MPRTIDAPSAIIFDFDGVIVHSEPLHCRAFVEIANAHGVTLTEPEYYREMIGFDDRGAWMHLFRQRRLPLDLPQLAGLMREKQTLARELLERGAFTALPGADSFIRRCATRRIPLAICSGALRGEIDLMLDGIGLREHFGVITAAEDVDVGKPDPRGYLLTARRLGEMIRSRALEPAECLVIEDAPTVALNAAMAGFNVLGLTTSVSRDRWPTNIATSASLMDEDLRELAGSLL